MSIHTNFTTSKKLALTLCEFLSHALIRNGFFLSCHFDVVFLARRMKHLNPTGIVALVQVDFSKAHNRDELFPAKSS